VRAYGQICVAVSLFLVASNTFSEGLDEWLGDDGFTENSLILSVGGDNDEGRSYGAQLNVALPAYAQLQLDYSHWESNTQWQIDDAEEISTEKESAFGLWLESDVWHRWSFALGYDFSDRKNILESESISLELNYALDEWTFSGIYSSGEIKAYLSSQVGRRVFNVSSDVAYQGYAGQLAYDFASWRWRIKYSDYQYDQSFSRIASFGQTRRNSLRVAMFDRASYLNDWQVSSDLQWYADGVTGLIGVAQSESVVSSEAVTQVFGGVDFQLTDVFSLGAFGGVLPDEDFVYAELTVGYHW